ncbi:MAG TPA: hypothetical protein VJA26_00865 [Gammaproteobacteria bacterium]|nr:hypothetical protein [Gammaproteobacteria bacterium]
MQLPHRSTLVQSKVASIINRSSARAWLVAAVAFPLLNACGVTSRMEPYKQTNAVISEGEHVVILARKQHATHEAEADFVECISDALAKGDGGLDVHSSTEFEDRMYPWFEPSTAPLSTDDLSLLLDRPGVLQRVHDTGVRYVVWLDGSTDRVASGGGITCAAGVGGAGCMGLAWWEDDARYDATVWDIQELTSAGTIHADVKGRSVMPAIIIPLPFIARPQAAACRGLTEQLKQFLTSPEGYGAGPDLG